MSKAAIYTWLHQNMLSLTSVSQIFRNASKIDFLYFPQQTEKICIGSGKKSISRAST